MTDMLALFLTDFYKVGHVSQYPSDTKQVWVNWTPRSSRVPGQKDVVFFGLQYFIREILDQEFDRNFFCLTRNEVLSTYRELIKATLGVENPRTDHIEALHNLGYLPLKIYALPEGFSTPLGVPALVMTNTDDRMFWLPNYLETILSNILWKASTSATTAQAYRKLFIKYAKQFGEKDMSFIDWQGHDFSMRGMSGREDVVLSGMGHLLSFSGTDSIPAIVQARATYSANYSCGGSVPATEHSVMCAGLKEGEQETFRRLIQDVYPSGIVSVVSDTWDLWKVLTEFVPNLKEVILARDGKVVIRPDSGDPVKIICGDQLYSPEAPQGEGTLRLLAKALGTKDGLINKAGAIYGDAISLTVADQILGRMVNELKLHPFNMVFGIGSYTYEYVTRDTYGFAMKATAVRRGDTIYDIFKDPVTSDGTKKSLKGIPAVYKTEESTDERPSFFVVDGQKPEALDNCAFNLVYENGSFSAENFTDIRKRVRAACE